MDITTAPLEMLPGDLIDPTTMDDLSRAVKGAIDAQVELLTTPLYPRWYNEKDYPKPDPGEAFSKVKVLEGEFGAVRTQIQEDYRSWRNETSGVPKDFIEGEDDPWIDAGITSEIELIAYQLSDSDLHFDAPATVMSAEEDAEKKIDFAIACYDDAKRQHNVAGHGSLQLDTARTLLTTGRLAWHCTLNLDAEEGEMPFNETMLDPATCYPVFENKRGMKIMARSYSTTVADVVGAFTTEDNDLTYLYKSKDSSKASYKETDTVTVTEYWDRKWRIVWMNGKVVVGPISHDYGFVPFVYKLGGLGLPGYMSDPTTMSHRDLAQIGFSQSWNPRDVSNPNKGISLIRLLRAPHHLREAVLTKIMTGFDKSINRPMTVEMDEMAYPEGVPEIDMGKNAVTPLKMGHQRLSQMDVNPSPQLMSVILNGAQENIDRLKLPATAHGLNDKSNVAGYATNVLNEAGQVKLVPHKRVLEEFLQECMEMRFRMFRDYGHLVQQGAYGEQGELTVPHSDSDPGQPRAFLIRPTDLRNSGVKMKIKMRSMSLQMLGVAGNAVSIMMQAGLIDKVGALKLLEDPNPYRTIRRIQAEAVMNDPAIQKMRVVETLRQQGMSEWADMYLQLSSGQGGGGGGGGGAPMLPEGGGSPVQTVVGDSNAQYGFGPGAGSGPQGPLGPRGEGPAF